ncbi:competence type IV pilus major pilin ComGC [Brevibacillus sp. NSP2.1]|uniref:competence type IV pilus major pilin ComGC n=1 Tax=Brevibacillus TaxID=55080 RepID=UPI00047AAF04|nr:type II secretion system protein [Brevibacillus sp. NSP2.1]QHZ58366.1 type II secretion system protein [Brevibacillus sp. NSP2.1]
MLKRMLKNERGFTLIELLAVIVILGIIAAIAVPSIGNIIDNSRKDSHIANARMIVDATRMYLVNNSSASSPVTLKTLVDSGYINNPTVPGFNSNYHDTDTKVAFTKDTTSGHIKEYLVTLVVDTQYVIGSATQAENVDELTREKVTLPTN